MVAARFGGGWTINAGNRTAWLLLAGLIAAPAGLALIATAAGM